MPASLNRDRRYFVIAYVEATAKNSTQRSISLLDDNTVTSDSYEGVYAYG
jgi:hypothetical protein